MGFDEGLALHREVVPRQRGVVATVEGSAVKLIELSIPGLFVLESPVWGDDRGFFREWFKDEDFRAAGVDVPRPTGEPLDLQEERRARTALLHGARRSGQGRHLRAR